MATPSTRPVGRPRRRIPVARTNIVLEADTMARVRATATARGQSISHTLRSLIRLGLDRHWTF